jgi:protein-disulfide isomerase
VIKNFPYKYRDYSHLAAEALLAAGDQDKYWEMHDVMLENSPWLGPRSLEKYASELGLDMERFRNDLEGMKHQGVIDSDMELANALGVYNTPTFYINGREVVGNRSYRYMKRLVEEELKNAEDKERSCSFCHVPVPRDPAPGDLPGR